MLLLPNALLLLGISFEMEENDIYSVNLTENLTLNLGEGNITYPTEHYFRAVIGILTLLLNTVCLVVGIRSRKRTNLQNIFYQMFVLCIIDIKVGISLLLITFSGLTSLSSLLCGIGFIFYFVSLVGSQMIICGLAVRRYIAIRNLRINSTTWTTKHNIVLIGVCLLILILISFVLVIAMISDRKYNKPSEGCNLFLVYKDNSKKVFIGIFAWLILFLMIANVFCLLSIRGLRDEMKSIVQTPINRCDNASKPVGQQKLKYKYADGEVCTNAAKKSTVSTSQCFRKGHAHVAMCMYVCDVCAPNDCCPDMLMSMICEFEDKFTTKKESLVSTTTEIQSISQDTQTPTDETWRNVSDSKSTDTQFQSKEMPRSLQQPLFKSDKYTDETFREQRTNSVCQKGARSKPARDSFCAQQRAVKYLTVIIILVNLFSWPPGIAALTQLFGVRLPVKIMSVIGSALAINSMFNPFVYLLNFRITLWCTPNK